jgi:hypothetical protein
MGNWTLGKGRHHGYLPFLSFIHDKKIQNVYGKSPTNMS